MIEQAQGRVLVYMFSLHSLVIGQSMFPGSIVVDDYINIMKTTLISILIYIKLLNSMNTQKRRNKEKLSIKKASL